MDFASFEFLFRFLPVFMILYFLAPAKAKKLVLFFGSLVFYAWGDRELLMRMLLSIAMDYVLGLLLGVAKRGWQRSLLLAVGVVLNLDILFSVHRSGWQVPAGSMIYCLQAVSYLAEVYRGTVPPQKNILRLGVYVAMFPQLALGPVVRYGELREQLAERSMDAERVKDGLIRFIIGLAKKVLLAENVCVFWNMISAAPPEELSTLSLWLGLVCLALKLLFDFSGYSDMAIGLAQMLGFSLNENFNYPLAAVSVRDFWKRWNISLSLWFREYVYIPLGGSRRGILRKWLHMLLTWLLIGVWYGRAHHYIIWSLWFFFWLVLESSFLGGLLEKLPRMLTRAYTWVIVIISIIFFAAENVGECVKYFQVLVGRGGVGLVDRMALFSLRSQAPIIVVAIISAMPWVGYISKRLRASETGAGMALLRVSEKLFSALLLLLTVAYMARG